MLSDYYSGYYDNYDNMDETNNYVISYFQVSLYIDKLAETGYLYVTCDYLYLHCEMYGEDQYTWWDWFYDYCQFEYAIDGNEITFSFDENSNYYSISTKTVKLDETGEFELNVNLEFTFYNGIEEISVNEEITIHLYI